MRERDRPGRSQEAVDRREVQPPIEADDERREEDLAEEAADRRRR
jgi:hypothetical protein